MLMSAMKHALPLIALLALTTSSSVGWTASATATASPAASQSSRSAIPMVRYISTIRTPNGRSIFVIDTSSVQRRASRFSIGGVPGKPAKIHCDNTGNQTDVFDCYDCGNQTIDDSTPYKGACTYLGFCTNGYNGNSSYCSF
jgi:hypothetical protein